jgi:tRNA G37 N-methylase TrmD
MLFLDVIILCLLPDVFPGNLGHSLAAKALRKQYMDLHNNKCQRF